jgi:PGF-pre-PGF domain-containing protein
LPVYAIEPTIDSQKTLFDDLKQNQKIDINVDSALLAFTSFETKLTEDINGMSSISIKNLIEKPTEVNQPDRIYQIYQYVQVDNSNIKETQLTYIIIDFKVPKNRIIKDNSSDNQISLLRYSFEEWQKLNTALIYTDTDYNHYRAISTGFNLFAIVAENATTLLSSSILELNDPQNAQNLQSNYTMNLSSEQQENITNASNISNSTADNITIVVNDPNTNLENSLDDWASQKADLLIIVMISILVMIIIVSMILYHKKKPNKRIKQYNETFSSIKDAYKYYIGDQKTIDKERKKPPIIDLSLLGKESLNKDSFKKEMFSSICKEFHSYAQYGINIEKVSSILIADGYPKPFVMKAENDIKNLVEYIDSELSIGNNFDAIKQKLIYCGWNEEEELVDMILNQYLKSRL